MFVKKTVEVLDVSLLKTLFEKNPIPARATFRITNSLEGFSCLISDEILDKLFKTPIRTLK